MMRSSTSGSTQALWFAGFLLAGCAEQPPTSFPADQATRVLAVDQKGTLTDFTTAVALPDPINHADVWTISYDLKGQGYISTTQSRIVLAVLDTVLFRSRVIEVQITVNEDKPTVIKRVRLDDRGSYCDHGDLGEASKGEPLIPLVPTVFADETPEKWGFFFSLGGKCKEFKGMSLDVFAVIAEVWRQGNGATVILQFDKDDHIIAAQPG